MNPSGFKRRIPRPLLLCLPASALLLVCSLLLVQACKKEKGPGMLDLEKLDAYLEKSRREWHVPGLAVAVVKDDSTVFARGYGVCEYGMPGRVDGNTLFNVASITKGFTASAMAMLVDEGKIGWDDPVQRYLPDFALYDPWVSREIRVRDLLCHRSGFRTFSGDLVWFETSYPPEEVLRRVRYLKPAYGFRYRYGYSNLMYLAAGEIVPAVTGISWNSFVGGRILRPLGMERTYLREEEFRDDPDVARPHFVDLPDTTPVVLPFMKWDNAAPAGAMYSNVLDLSRWIRFQLAMGNWNGEQLISRENIWETREMHTVRPVDMGNRKIWPSTHFSGYGLGWELYDYHGWKIIAHEGGTDGILSRLVLVPEENFGFVILSNSVSSITTALEYYILDQYWQGKSYDWSALYLEDFIAYREDTKREWEAYLAGGDTTVGPSLEPAGYAGLYGCELYGNVEVREEKGQLLLDFLPSEKMVGDLEHFSGDTFLIRLRDMPALPQGTVKFFLDPGGKAAELRVEIPSPDFDFTELELKRKTVQRK
jgi:CubicO group peptidase (beta-lactamase class C family)